MAGRELLSVGLIWRIENGKSTKIWKDQWIPRQFSNKIQSPMPRLEEQAKVVELIHEDYPCWKEEVIQDLALSSPYP